MEMGMMKKAIFAVLFMATIFVLQVQSQDIFFDFEDMNQFDEWEYLAGYWDIDGGYYYEMDDADGPLVTLTGDTALTDYTLTVKAMGLVADGDWGVVFRAQDISNYYTWQFQNNALVFIVYSGGSTSTLYSQALTEALNEWQEFKVVVKGDTFECYWNGELKTTITDTTFTSGRVGLFGWVNSGSDLGENFGYLAFDNFYVTNQEAWTVTRTFPSTGYRIDQGSMEGIALNANVAEGGSVSQLTVTENIPTDLTISNIQVTAGTFTNENGVITWTLTNLSGSATLTYDITTPTVLTYGDILFSGSVTDGSMTKLLSASLPLIYEVYVPLTTPIQFDFADASQDSEWEDLAGDWGTQDGLFYEFDDADGPLVTVTGDPNITDYTITVKAMGLVSGADWGITFRVQNIDNHYSWQFVNGALEFIRYFKGSRTTLFTEALAETLNEWQTFRVEVNKNDFAFYWNDTLKTTATDTNLTWGRIGLFGWVNAGSPVADTIGGIVFDDFSATGPTQVSEWMTY